MISDGSSKDGCSKTRPVYGADSSLDCRQEGRSLVHLPLELLLEVFSHFEIAESWHPFFGCVRRSGLAKLMCVCRDWHALICMTAEFWRFIDTTDSLELISLCLRRSRGSMVDVHVSLGLLHVPEVDLFPDQIRSLGGEAVSLIIPHASRIRSLSVDLSPDDFYLVEPLFEEPLPALQDLTITPVKIRLRSRRWIDVNLSRAMQPSLRSLVVRHVHLPPPSEFWHSLRVLKLFSFPESTSRPVSAWDILNILQNNPFLEEVHFIASDQEAVQGTPSESHRESPKAYCPDLRTFVFHGPLQLVTELLSELSFPENIPHVDIRIRSPIERFEWAFSFAIPRHSRVLLERMSDVSFQTIPDCRLSSAICQFKLTSPSRRPTSPLSDGRVTALAFECRHGSDYPEAPSSLRSLPFRFLTRVLAWTTVRCLRITPLPDSTDAVTYEGFLDNFPSLESLSLCPFSLAGTRDLLVALQPERRESDGSLDIPRCPNLRTLAIHEGTPDRSGEYELLETLLECVRVRAEAGARLDEVDVHLYCYTFWMVGVHEHRERRVLDVIERLRTNVGSVVWKYGWDAACKGCGG